MHVPIVQVWSTKLETKAQQWADGCIYKHSPDVSGEDIGENIAYSSDTDLLNEEQVYNCGGTPYGNFQGSLRIISLQSYIQ